MKLVHVGAMPLVDALQCERHVQLPCSFRHNVIHNVLSMTDQIPGYMDLWAKCIHALQADDVQIQ